MSLGEKSARMVLYDHICSCFTRIRRLTADLNLLRTFRDIYETGSITRTAEARFVTQPSVSHALTRLRRELSDDLFVRRGGRMKPAPWAVGLYVQGIRRQDRPGRGQRPRLRPGRFLPCRPPCRCCRRAPPRKRCPGRPTCLPVPGARCW
ncbi:LysR family transcriptional regulator, partial [Arthrobacter sp. GCM10027362]|uniref:helix-turn-helix domain-containing protein n=1 Tax=Arthrobacter sp. GCM10027362 TaxID=3273379 RepID=UPI00363590A3